MNVTTDPLDAIPDNDIPKMLELYKANFPETIHAYSFIAILESWKQKRPNLDVYFLAPRGDFRNGVFFYNLQGKELIGSAYVPDEDAKISLKNALARTKRFPPVDKLLISCLTKRTFQAVETFFRGDLLMSGELLASSIGDLVLWLPWNEARDLEVVIPEDVEIRFLSPSHSDQIDAIWPHRYPGSRELIADCITLNFGMGVFRGEDLVSWAVYWFYGGIGAVQTEEKEKRKGYGRAVVQAVTKELGERQIDVHVNVVEGNSVGAAFFRSLGFKFAFNSIWCFKDSGCTK